ncbi:MAG: hypothetical protein AAF688_00930 [Bacteroidota bacterium]
MRTTFKIMLLALFLIAGNNAEAQIFKKLKEKINKTISGNSDDDKDDTSSDEKKSSSDDNAQSSNATKKTSGSAIIKHGKKYGNFNIDEFGKSVADIADDEVRIYGSWVTMAADIQDGYVLVIPNGQARLFDGKKPKKEQIKLNIPEDAQLKLSYDPVYDPNFKDEYGRSSAVTKDYQNYELQSGTVTLDVFSEDNIQISFNGTAKLETRTENPNKNSEEQYIVSYTTSSVSGAIDVSPVNFQDRRTVKKKKKDLVKAPKFESGPDTAKGSYQFSFETKVKITDLKKNESYNISYLLNPNAEYIGMKADMGEYSQDELQGESLIVMDEGSVQIFVETEGMKMRMSQGMMGGQQMQNPTEQMADYNYNGLQKTGKTKTILGATCYEYVMSDNEVTINLWVAPDVNLPNWFIQNQDVLKGHIMEYTMESKDGKVKSETVSIEDNINKTINPKEYRKMF